VFQKPKKAAPDRENVRTGYGDASACLKLRIPLIRRDRLASLQILCPRIDTETARKPLVPASNVLRSVQTGKRSTSDGDDLG
jgi:hypothetical protein